MNNSFFKQAGNLDSDGLHPKKEISEVPFFKKPEEMVDYFKVAGNLDDSMDASMEGVDLSPFRTPEEMVGYFKTAGDLDSDGLYPKKEESEVPFFTKPEEIVGYFRPAGNLNDINKKVINNDEEIINKINNNTNIIQDYLLTVVSGKKYDSVCELGVLMGGGKTIVTFARLKQMVEQGYNIVSATIIGSDMIEIEYQKYIYNEELMERRRRF